MRLAPGFRFYVRIFHYVADRRSIDAGTADHGLACLADPAVIFRVSRDLFVLAHVFALPESAALRRVDAFAMRRLASE